MWYKTKLSKLKTENAELLAGLERAIEALKSIKEYAKQNEINYDKLQCKCDKLYAENKELCSKIRDQHLGDILLNVVDMLQERSENKLSKLKNKHDVLIRTYLQRSYDLRMRDQSADPRLFNGFGL